MNGGNLLTVLSLFYSVLLIIVFNSKKKIESIENNVYSLLIISNFFGILIAIACYFTVLNYQTMLAINYIVSRLYLVYLVFFIFVFFFYLVISIYSEDNKITPKINKFLSLLIIMFIIICGLIFALPLYYTNTSGAVYSYGPAANLIYIIATVCMVTWSFILIKNYKKIKNKKFLPIIIFILGAMLVTVIQKMNPALLLMTSMETFVTVVMFFTIENPDLKMIENYHDAKQYADDLNTEKQMFVYNMSQEMKTPLLKTSKFCEDLLYSDNVEDYKNGVRSIKGECNSLIQKINSTFDIEVTDIRDLGTNATKYDLYNMLKTVTNTMEKKVLESDKKIEFIHSISDTLPKNLIGDSSRLREVLKIIFDNALEHTEQGFIELKVQGLSKGNVCRLMISLEDSGNGIDADKLDELFDRDRIIDKKSNDNRIDSNKKNLSLAKRIINVLGGNLIITSELTVGTKVRIVLDQEFVQETENSDMKRYEEKYFDKNQVLLLGGTEEEQKVFMRQVATIGGVMETSESMNELIDKINKRKRYSVLILDGDMPYHTIGQMTERLKAIKGFNSKIVVLTANKDMKSTKNRAIVGIQGYISRPLNNNTVKETLEQLLFKK